MQTKSLAQVYPPRHEACAPFTAAEVLLEVREALRPLAHLAIPICDSIGRAREWSLRHYGLSTVDSFTLIETYHWFR